LHVMLVLCMISLAARRDMFESNGPRRYFVAERILCLRYNVEHYS
jgi:hypothetical protein